VWTVSASDKLVRRQVFILEAAGLICGSGVVSFHHTPYIPYTAGLVAALASLSTDIMQVLATTSLSLSLSLSLCLYVSLPLSVANQSHVTSD